MNHDVFISYSRRDTKIADTICEAFDKAGISYWIDREGVTSGEAFHEKIVKAIKECKITVFISSVNSNNISEYAIKEIVVAFKSKKHIIPFCIDEEPFADKIEFYLCDLDQLAYYLGKEFAIQRLVEDITRLLNKKKPMLTENEVTKSIIDSSQSELQNENKAPHSKIETAPTKSNITTSGDRETQTNGTKKIVNKQNKTLTIIALVVLIGGCLGIWKSGILGSKNATTKPDTTNIVTDDNKGQSSQNVPTEENEPFVTIEEGDAEKGNGKGTISFHYGKYSGEIKKFKANGEGRLVFYKKHKLSANDPDKMAEPKDVFDGLFENNEPTYGRWLDANGNQKGSLLTKKTGLKE